MLDAIFDWELFGEVAPASDLPELCTNLPGPLKLTAILEQFCNSIVHIKYPRLYAALYFLVYVLYFTNMKLKVKLYQDAPGECY